MISIVPSIFFRVPPVIWILSQIHETNWIHTLSKVFFNILIHTAANISWFFLMQNVFPEKIHNLSMEEQRKM